MRGSHSNSVLQVSRSLRCAPTDTLRPQDLPTDQIGRALVATSTIPRGGAQVNRANRNHENQGIPDTTNSQKQSDRFGPDVGIGKTGRGEWPEYFVGRKDLYVPKLNRRKEGI